VLVCVSGGGGEGGGGGGVVVHGVAVDAEAAVERKEVRRTRPLLSELPVPEWQELAVDWGKRRKYSAAGTRG
jgi:hypothetical protein